MNPGSRLAAGTYWALDLQRGAAEKSLTVSVLNELRPSRGKRSPETSLAEILTGVGAGRTLACRSTTEARAPAGAPEYKPGVSPRTPGKPFIAGQALNGRQTSCGQRRSAGGLREVRVQAGSLDLPGPGLTRGAAEKSLRVSVLNELRPSRGKGSPETSLVHGRHRLPAGAMGISFTSGFA